MEFPIGTRLKELRKARRLSITGLAEKSGVSTGLISQIERDLVVPSVVNLYRIAQALGTDISLDGQQGMYLLTKSMLSGFQYSMEPRKEKAPPRGRGDKLRDFFIFRHSAQRPRTGPWAAAR